MLVLIMLLSVLTRSALWSVLVHQSDCNLAAQKVAVELGQTSLLFQTRSFCHAL